MNEKVKVIEYVKPDGSSVMCLEDGRVLSRCPPGTFFIYNSEETMRTSYLSPEQLAEAIRRDSK